MGQGAPRRFRAGLKTPSPTGSQTEGGVPHAPSGGVAHATSMPAPETPRTWWITLSLIAIALGTVLLLGIGIASAHALVP